MNGGVISTEFIIHQS